MSISGLVPFFFVAHTSAECQSSARTFTYLSPLFSGLFHRSFYASFSFSFFPCEEGMVRGDLTVKIYRRLGKKRYLRGKHVYEYERIHVPIPSRLHNKVKPFLNHRLKITIASQNEDLVIKLHPVKTFRPAELPPVKTSPKHGPRR